MSDSGRAPTLTGTNGPLARRDWRWSARATSSLPVPLSPVRSTVLSERATFETSRKMRRIRGLAPTMLRNGSRSTLLPPAGSLRTDPEEVGNGGFPLVKTRPRPVFQNATQGRAGQGGIWVGAASSDG